MKREILFRGKRKDNGEWVTGFYFSVYHSAYIRVVEYIAPTFNQPDLGGEEIKDYEVEPETVDQYTGWEDQKGQKIFDGDIDFDGNECTWEPMFCAFMLGDTYLGIYNAKGLDIVGNIHDNPNLLQNG